MRPQLKAMAMACTAAALLAAPGAWAQQSRASLADRVATLEARDQAQGQQNIELLNRITQLEADVKELRALVEQMQNENQQARDRDKAQYDDVDARLGRLENAASQLAAPTTRTPTTPVKAPPAHAPSIVPPKPANASPAAAAGGDADHPVTDRVAYDNAFAAMKAERYADSAQLFSAFVQQYPDSPLAPNAYYWMGESYYVTQNYQYALTAFKSVVARYPDSPKTPGAMLKIGYCQDGLKQRDAAEATLRAVIQKYPNSEEASQAQSRLRAMSMDAGG